MKPDIKIGICQWSLPIEGPYSCKIVSELGIEGIQLDIGRYNRGFQLSKRVVQEAYLELAEEFGITYPSIAITELDNFSMTHPISVKEMEIANTAINKAIEAAEAMKIPIVMIPSFERSNIKTEEDFDNAINVLKRACEYAQDKGIIIATENLLPVDKIFELFEKVNYSNLKLYFDTQNHYLHKGYNIPKMLEELMSLICQIHVKDGKNSDLSGALLGEGETGFYKSMEVIKKSNYSGWVISENYYDREPLSLQNEDPIELIKQDVKTLKSVVYSDVGY